MDHISQQTSEISEHEKNNEDIDIKKLGNLLQKKRNSKKEIEVSKIIKSELDINDKIRLIELVDNSKNFDFASYLEKFKSKIKELQQFQDDSLIQLLRKEHITSPLDAKKSQEKLKLKIKKSSFLGFIFKEFPRVRQFTEKSHIIDYNFFPPQIYLNKDVSQSFTSNLHKRVLELSHHLHKILDIGWLYLTKKEFNLLGQFNDLCKTILSTNFLLLNFKDKNLIQKLADLEKRFVICVNRPSYINLIISSMSMVIEKNPDWKISIQEITSSVQSILSPNFTLPSLYNFILGLNMVKYNKYLEFNQIYKINATHLINTYDFDCDFETKNKIKSMVSNTVNDLLDLIKQQYEINKIKKYIKTSNKVEDYNYNKIKYFYEKENEDKKLNITSDKENMLNFTEVFFQTYVIVFEDFLTANVEIETGEAVKIFSSDYFQFEIGKIKFLLSKLTKISYSVPSLIRSRYLFLKSSRKGGIINEVEIIQIISELTSILIKISFKLIDLVELHDAMKDDKSINDKRPVIIDQYVINRGKFRIPYYDKKMVTHSVSINNKPIYKVFIEIISLSLLVSIFFHDSYIPRLLNKEEKINSEIRNKKYILERICTILEYREVINKYNL